MKMQLNVQIAS